MVKPPLSPAQKAWATRRAKSSIPRTAPQVSNLQEAGSLASLADAELLALFSSVGAVVSQRFLMRQPCLTTWSLVLDYLKSAMAFRHVEQFRILFLDKRNVLVADEVLSTGTIDHVTVYPREVARRALELHACSVILVHNHPSGDPAPSSTDVELTKHLRDALKLFGISVHDHIVIGRQGHASMRSLKLF